MVSGKYKDTMELKLVRDIFSAYSATGKLYIDSTFECYTLEDAVREVDGQPVASWKVAGLTAIPRGKYKLAWTFSNRFQKNTLQIMDVPGFQGIRIHAGNDAGDTEGCILLGQMRLADKVYKSRDAVKALEDKIVPVITGGEGDVHIIVS